MERAALIMTIGEKERRIKKFGTPWTWLADAMKNEAKLTETEAAGQFASEIRKAKRQYYGHALKSDFEMCTQTKIKVAHYPGVAQFD